MSLRYIRKILATALNNDEKSLILLLNTIARTTVPLTELEIEYLKTQLTDVLVQKNPIAAMLKGALYFTGQGFTKNCSNAILLYKQAISLGAPHQARDVLALSYRSGACSPDNMPDYTEAITLYDESIKLNSTVAMLGRAQMYIKGSGELNNLPNYKEAILLLKKAVDAGHASSMCYLGRLYQRDFDQYSTNITLNEIAILYRRGAKEKDCQQSLLKLQANQSENLFISYQRYAANPMALPALLKHSPETLRYLEQDHLFNAEEKKHFLSVLNALHFVRNISSNDEVNFSSRENYSIQDILLRTSVIQPLFSSMPYPGTEPCSNFLIGNQDKAELLNLIHRACIIDGLIKMTRLYSLRHIAYALVLTQLNQTDPLIEFFPKITNNRAGGMYPNNVVTQLINPFFKKIYSIFPFGYFKTLLPGQIDIWSARPQNLISSAIAHEGAHLVMDEIYHNFGLPFYFLDINASTSFYAVMNQTMRNLHALYLEDEIPNELELIAKNLNQVSQFLHYKESQIVSGLCEPFLISSYQFNENTKEHNCYKPRHISQCRELVVKLPEIITLLNDEISWDEDFFEAIRPLSDDWKNRITPDILTFIDNHPLKNKLTLNTYLPTYNESFLNYADQYYFPINKPGQTLRSVYSVSPNENLFSILNFILCLSLISLIRSSTVRGSLSTFCVFLLLNTMSLRYTTYFQMAGIGLLSVKLFFNTKTNITVKDALDKDEKIISHPSDNLRKTSFTTMFNLFYKKDDQVALTHSNQDEITCDM